PRHAHRRGGGGLRDLGRADHEPRERRLLRRRELSVRGGGGCPSPAPRSGLELRGACARGESSSSVSQLWFGCTIAASLSSEGRVRRHASPSENTSSPVLPSRRSLRG